MSSLARAAIDGWRIPTVALRRVLLLTDCSDLQTALRSEEPEDLDAQGFIPYRVDPFEGGAFEIGIGIRSLLAKRFRRWGEDAPERVVLGNSAVRLAGSGRRDAVPFVAVWLPGNLLYVGTAGRCLSWVKEFIQPQRAWLINPTASDTDYRSAYLLECYERMTKGERCMVVEPLDVDSIPDPPAESFVIRDSFGNMITTLTAESPLFNGHQYGERLRVTINGRSHRAVYGTNIGAAKTGELVVAPGSTSLSFRDEQERVMYIYQVTGHAAALFRLTWWNKLWNWVYRRDTQVHFENGLPLCGATVKFEWR